MFIIFLRESFEAFFTGTFLRLERNCVELLTLLPEKWVLLGEKEEKS